MSHPTELAPADPNAAADPHAAADPLAAADPHAAADPQAAADPATAPSPPDPALRGRSRADGVVGKMLGLLWLAGLGTALLYGTEGLEEGPWWAFLLLLAVVGGGAALVYEGTGWAFARLVTAGRTRWRRRVPTGDPVPGDGHRFGPSAALGTFLAFILTMFAVWMAVAIILVVRTGGADADFTVALFRQAPWLLLASMLLGLAAAGGAFLRVASPRDRVVARRWLASGRPAVVLVVGLCGVAAVGLFGLVAPLLADPAGATPSALLDMQNAATPLGQAIMVVVIVAIAPVVEEVLFRGIVLDGFLRRWGPFASVLAATLLFVAVHIPDVISYWPSAAMIGLLGAGAAYLRLRFRAIGPAIALHAGYNLGVMVMWTAATVLGG